MGKGGTRFVSEPIAVRSGRQRQTFSSRELEQDMAVYQETGVHPEIERAVQEHESSPRIRPLPDFNQNRPFIFLEIAIDKAPIGRCTIELFDEHNPFTVGLLLHRCRNGAQDSLKHSTFHKLMPDFAAFFGKTRAHRQLAPHPHLHHVDRGAVSMSVDGGEFAITLTEGAHGLNSTHQVIGRVYQGMEMLDRINDVSCGPLDLPLDEISITNCGLTDHQGVSTKLESPAGAHAKGGHNQETIEKKVAEEHHETKTNLQSALAEGLHQEQKNQKKKRKRNMLPNFSSSSSSSDVES